MIKVENLWFKYDEKYVLKGIDIEFRKGLTLILGPNGAGKTTLLKIIAGLLKPIKGEVYIDDTPLYEKSYEGKLNIRRNITYVHETPIMLRGTVFENILYGQRVRGERTTPVIDEIIEKFNIKNFLYNKASSLSMGQKQLVALARAFAIKPKYLLLDEPLQYLDKNNREDVWDIISEYARKNTIIIATHDKFLIEKTNNFIFLIDGKINNKVII